MIRGTFAIALAVFLMACTNEQGPPIVPGLPDKLWDTKSGEAPIIIAHRGASGYRPEHTLEAYELAIDQGADFIEPDLVITKDGHLIARHDRYLSTTTNVADFAEFADRKTVKPGRGKADWYAEDFTLAEIKQLRARQPFPGRSRAFDDTYSIPTFAEVLELANAKSAELDRRVGVYPETKQPTALEALGLSFDAPLIADLTAADYEGFGAPVYIQSFEPEILERLNKITTTKLVYLIAAPTDLELTEIANFADGIGPNKLLLLTSDGASSGLLEQAHEAGLEVHSWTFRDDARGGSFDDIAGELNAYMMLGLDGIFTDFPDTALAVRTDLAEKLRPGD